jgi:hypothetical protein
VGEKPPRPEPVPELDSEQVARLSAELEGALVRELQRAYRQLNESLFGGALRPAILELSSAHSWLGRWCSPTRTLEVGRALALEKPWVVVIEVLKHEMAHQYVDEVLGDTDQGHGPTFRCVCKRLGIDSKASGVPEPGSGEEEERVLSRVARLLALADSPNENEAQAAMSAAQRLMLRYNIDQAQARSRERCYGFRQVGRITGRVSEAERILAGLLVNHFFVDAIWVTAYQPRLGKPGSVLEICGTEANLAMADYVHAFMTHTAQGLWEAHQRANRITSNRDRQTFLAGVMVGFHERMASEKSMHEGAGLVWKGDADLEKYLRRRHPHVRKIRVQGNPRTEARERGKEAGRDIVLRKPVEGPSSNRGKLLPSRR